MNPAENTEENAKKNGTPKTFKDGDPRKPKTVGGTPGVMKPAGNSPWFKVADAQSGEMLVLPVAAVLMVLHRGEKCDLRLPGMQFQSTPEGVKMETLPVVAPFSSFANHDPDLFQFRSFDNELVLIRRSYIGMATGVGAKTTLMMQDGLHYAVKETPGEVFEILQGNTPNPALSAGSSGPISLN